MADLLFIECYVAFFYGLVIKVVIEMLYIVNLGLVCKNVVYLFLHKLKMLWLALLTEACNLKVVRVVIALLHYDTSCYGRIVILNLFDHKLRKLGERNPLLGKQIIIDGVLSAVGYYVLHILIVYV